MTHVDRLAWLALCLFNKQGCRGRCDIIVSRRQISSYLICMRNATLDKS